MRVLFVSFVSFVQAQCKTCSVQRDTPNGCRAEERKKRSKRTIPEAAGTLALALRERRASTAGNDAEFGFRNGCLQVEGAV